jgi:methionyl-tRNA formyltransferase
MDAGLDSGPIVLQEAIEVPDETTYAELEAQTSRLGGQLLVQAVHQMLHGTAAPQPQDESQSHTYPYPTSADLLIQPEQWDARQVANFISGIKDWSGLNGQPLLLQADQELTLKVEDVIVFSYKPNDLRLQTSERNAWPIRCKRGKIVIVGRRVE